jgi:hypothetical protein
MSLPNRDKSHQRHCLTTNHICATTSSRPLPFPPGKPRVTRPLRISALIRPPAPHPAPTSRSATAAPNTPPVTPSPRRHTGNTQPATPCRRRTTCDTRPRHHTRDARPRDASPARHTGDTRFPAAAPVPQQQSRKSQVPREALEIRSAQMIFLAAAVQARGLPPYQWRLYSCSSKGKGAIDVART